MFGLDYSKSKVKREVLPPIVYEKTREEWNLIPKASKVVDADGIEQDTIVYVPTKVREYSIEAMINSYADDVGIQNILKKVALTGDKSYLNQTGRVPLTDGGLEPIQDYTNVPKSKTEAFNAVAAGVAAFDNLPSDIKQKMSFSQLAETFGQKEFDDYITNKINALMPKQKEESK